MVLDDNLRVLLLYAFGELSQQGGLSDACHVLEADLFCASFYELVGNVVVVVKGVYGRGGDAERALRSHACLLGPLDGGDDVPHVVETVEDAGDVGSLCVLHLVHKGADVIGHGVHSQGIETAVEHVGLDANLVERLAECPHGIVGVLAGKQVHLLEGSTVGLYAGKTSHVYYYGSDALQLVLAWLELTRALPHVSVDETELYFLFHNLFQIRPQNYTNKSNYLAVPMIFCVLLNLFCRKLAHRVGFVQEVVALWFARACLRPYGC